MATLAWLCGISQLSPPQKSGKIWPHLAMIAVASVITKTTTDHLKKARDTQKRVKDLLRDLRRSKNPLNVEEVFHASNNLARAYPVIHEFERE